MPAFHLRVALRGSKRRIAAALPPLRPALAGHFTRSRRG